MFFSTKQAGASPHAPTESAPAAPAEPMVAPRATGDRVFVLFKKWTAWGETAYQPGQCAGFSRRDADALIKKGAAREIL